MSALGQELPDVRVHCDLAPAQALWQQREAYEALLAGNVQHGEDAARLSELVNPLVLTDAGTLKPVAYDFDARYDVARLGPELNAQLRAYKHAGLNGFRVLLTRALSALEGRMALVDWFDHLTRMSHMDGRPLPRSLPCLTSA